MFFIAFDFVHSQEESKIELISIEFVGNNYFPSSELSDVITSKESANWFSQFLYSFSSLGSGATYFDSLSIQSEVNLLKNYYFSNGFFRAIINATFTIEKNTNNRARLTFNIYENQLTNFKNI